MITKQQTKLSQEGGKETRERVVGLTTVTTPGCGKGKVREKKRKKERKN